MKPFVFTRDHLWSVLAVILLNKFWIHGPWDEVVVVVIIAWIGWDYVEAAFSWLWSRWFKKPVSE